MVVREKVLIKLYFYTHMTSQQTHIDPSINPYWTFKRTELTHQQPHGPTNTLESSAYTNDISLTHKRNPKYLHDLHINHNKLTTSRLRKKNEHSLILPFSTYPKIPIPVWVSITVGHRQISIHFWILWNRHSTTEKKSDFHMTPYVEIWFPHDPPMKKLFHIDHFHRKF